MNDEKLYKTYHEFTVLTDKLLSEDVKAIEIAHKDEIKDLSEFMPELH